MRSSCILLLRNEVRVGAGLEHDVRPLPWIVVDEPPFVTRAGVVGRNKHVARVDRKRFAVPRIEFERTGKRDDELRMRRDVPFQRRIRRRLFEKNRLRLHEGIRRDGTAFHVRIAVGPGVQEKGANHCSTRATCSTSAVSSRTRRQSSSLSMSDCPNDGIMLLSCAPHPLLTRLPKHCCKTLSIIATAVDAPGDAPSIAIIEPSFDPTSSV